MTSEPQFSVYRPDRPGIRKVLGDLEANIMEIVWARPAAKGTTVRDVFEVLYERRRIAYTTVMNTMSRLARKRLLRTERDGQTFIYYPTLAHQEFVSRLVGRILEDLLVGFEGTTIESLDALRDPEAAARSRAVLEEIVRRRAAEEDR